MKSIQCKDMIKHRINGYSIYDNKFHRVIIGSDNTIEYYDINKDYWILINSETNFNYSSIMMNIKPNIFISDYNPNILFISGRVNAGNNRVGIVTEMIDLRKTNCKWKMLLLYDIDDNLNYYKDYGIAHHLIL
eukprot:45446_1